MKESVRSVLEEAAHEIEQSLKTHDQQICYARKALEEAEASSNAKLKQLAEIREVLDAREPLRVGDDVENFAQRLAEEMRGFQAGTVCVQGIQDGKPLVHSFYFPECIGMPFKIQPPA